MTRKIDWEPIQALAQRVVEHGETLELRGNVSTLLRRSAREVAIPARDVERALENPRTAKALLRKIQQRIRDGARRFGSAQSRAYRMLDAGDLDGARKQMQAVIEAVPFYRELAENVISNIARFQAAATS
jgi:DUSAM domain-containing protein